MEREKQEFTNLEITLSEHPCDACSGSDSECDCAKGFNPGMRWTACLTSEYEKDDSDWPISQNTSKTSALAEIYNHAYEQKVRVIVLTTKRWREAPDTRRLRPRYLPQKRREAEQKKREARARRGDILLALWSLNRAAKRQRDKMQQAVYFDRSEFYQDKNQALAYLLAEGRLAVEGVHKIGNVYAEVLRGNGYSFHRPAPEPTGDFVDIGEKIEAKPVDASEMDANFALDVLRLYLEGKPRIETYSWPDTRLCFNCYKTGHIASRCPELEHD